MPLVKAYIICQGLPLTVNALVFQMGLPGVPPEVAPEEGQGQVGPSMPPLPSLPSWPTGKELGA